jgi:cytochrome d ubiquinol oxidase subunit I
MGFVVFYSALLVVDLYLMLKYIRLGPDETLGHAVALPGVRVPEAAEA